MAALKHLKKLFSWRKETFRGCCDKSEITPFSSRDILSVEVTSDRLELFSRRKDSHNEGATQTNPAKSLSLARSCFHFMAHLHIPILRGNLQA